MPFSVQFVGLVCFYRERGGRLALLPDGRNPGDDIDPHYGGLVVAADSVESIEGWSGVEGLVPGRFPLDPCRVFIDGIDAEDGSLDTSLHDDFVPHLKKIDSKFEIDPERAQTVAKIRIRRGKLTAFYVPGGKAVISQLDVPHDGPIHIRVVPDDGSAERRIVLKPGTEIAVTNMARGNIYQQARAQRTGPRTGDHFRIYEKLSVNPVTLKTPANEIENLLESPSHHVIFSTKGPITLYGDCANTGCC